MSDDPTRLCTERLTLRAWAPSDRAALAKILGDSDVMAFSDAGPLTADQIDLWLSVQQSDRLSWAIEAEQGVIGYIKLSAARAPESEFEIGFRLAQKAWGCGYAFEAATAVLEAIKAPVTAVVDPANAHSMRVLENLGFGYVRPIMFKGYDHPDHLFVRASG